jgi:hypothetical protein
MLDTDSSYLAVNAEGEPGILDTARSYYAEGELSSWTLIVLILQ